MSEECQSAKDMNHGKEVDSTIMLHVSKQWAISPHAFVQAK